MTHADRGKVAETLVKKFLANACTTIDKVFHRFPDARAGSFQPTLADFMFMRSGHLVLIEVKTTAHNFRLPHGNFDVAQVSRLLQWGLAGASPLVLVYHSKLGLWRGYPIGRFTEREGGSWDLRDTEPTTLQDLLMG